MREGLDVGGRGVGGESECEDRGGLCVSSGVRLCIVEYRCEDECCVLCVVSCVLCILCRGPRVSLSTCLPTELIPVFAISQVIKLSSALSQSPHTATWRSV